MVLTPRVVHGVGYHTDKPFRKIFLPFAGVGYLYRVQEFADMPVFGWIEKRQGVEVFPYGMYLSCEIAFQYGTDVLGRGDNTSGRIQPAPERVQNKFRNGLVQARRTCSPVFRPALYGIEPEIVQDVQQAFDALVLGLPALDVPCIITSFLFHREVC